MPSLLVLPRPSFPLFPLSAILLLLVSSSPAADPPRPGPWPPRGYACTRTTGPVTIDGLLNEEAWADAAWTEPFVDIEGDRKPRPPLRTRVRMLWDETFLYIGADLEEPHLWATLRERDSIIFHDNDFEVFIDPDGDSHLYTEIEINSFDTVWDLLLVRPYRDGGPAIHAWDIPGLRTAVHLDGSVDDASDVDRGWSVEIAIPFAVLDETTDASCPPAAGDRWRINFSRVEWRLEASGSGYRKSLDPHTGKPFPEDNWVWSPQRQIAMHEPEHWGIVEFRAPRVENGKAPEKHGETTAPSSAPGSASTPDPTPDPPVLPTPEDAAAWYLRYASYCLAERFESQGSYPLTFLMPAIPSGGPPLDDDWEWPPVYWSDGSRYSLTVRRGTGALTLTEDGRLRSFR